MWNESILQCIKKKSFLFDKLKAFSERYQPLKKPLIDIDLRGLSKELNYEPMQEAFLCKHHQPWAKKPWANIENVLTVICSL